MKTNRLVLFFILYPFLIYSQINQIDSVIIHHCRGNGTNNYNIIVDSLDINGLLINSTNYWNDTLGVPGNQWIYSYSATHKLLHLIEKDFQNSVWIIAHDQVWQYDLNDSLFSYTNLYYSSGLASFGNRYLYSYDTINHVNIHIYQDYIDSTSSWVNYSRGSVYFDSLGRKNHIVNESWVTPGVFNLNASWWFYYLPNDSIDFYSEFDYNNIDSTTYQNVYDPSGYLIQTMGKNWTSGSGYNANMTSYYYDSNHNQISAASHNWLLQNWQLCDTSTNAYDNQNRLINYFSTETAQCGHGGSSGWNVFNPSGNIDSLNQCTWTMGTSNCSTCSLEYISLVSSIQSVIKDFDISIFPNPSKDEIIISLSPFINPIVINFIDNTGRIVKTDKMNQERKELSISDLASGIYFVSVKESIGAPIRIIKL